MSKHTAMSIAHEICDEYNIGCVICGDRPIQLHHLPSKGELKGQHLCEILYVTVFSLCTKCHANYHKGNISEKSIRMILVNNRHTITFEHIDRIVARNVRI